MKKCFGVSLDNRFLERPSALTDSEWQDRKECFECKHLERCAAVMMVTLQARRVSKNDLS